MVSQFVPLLLSLLHKDLSLSNFKSLIHAEAAAYVRQR